MLQLAAASRRQAACTLDALELPRSTTSWRSAMRPAGAAISTPTGGSPTRSAIPSTPYLRPVDAVARSINAGASTEAERLAGEAHAIGQPLGVDNVDGVLGVQMFTIRREQGRLQEVAPFVKHFVAEHGAGAAWRPGLALIYADLEQSIGCGRRVRAARRRRLPVGAGRFAVAGQPLLPGRGLRLPAGRGACRRPLRLLLPYADLTVSSATRRSASGATARFLGQLAWTMARGR